MEDPYSSVKNMLRWQIDLARKRVVELRETLHKRSELYPLPKPTDGLPDDWAFGNLTPHQVALADAIAGLNWVSHEIEKTENALASGDFPAAISWIINVNQSICSTNAMRVSWAAVRMYRYVGEYRKDQSVRARLPRGKINDKGETIKGIVESLAASRAHEEESAKELWPKFYSELDERNLDPVESPHSADLNKAAYEYDFDGSRKRITFGRFATIVSNCRTKKSR